MGRKKVDIRSTIIQCATALFIQHGYSGVTMRMLAQECHTSLGNLYTYYESKDAIFDEVVSPILHAIDHLNRQHNLDHRVSLEAFHDINLTLAQEINKVVDEYADELELLMFSSKGSRHENYIERFVQVQVDLSFEFLELLKEKFPDAKVDISEAFVRLQCESSIKLVGIMVKERIAPAERRRLMLEQTIFSMAGWKALLFDRAES
ncbi:MAG: hypothetical protein CSA97_05865 [Bacteroidetes bacterium]|nr:MAG: hypothetical protein CSA97_05865 [Bacteroidota bacterium]